MKTVAQVLVGILFVIFFTIVLFASTVRFGLLDYNFWAASFDRHDVYRNLAGIVKNSVNDQVGKEGGKGSDVEVLTDLITPENTKDVVNNNLANFIDFLNGKAKEIIVYIPINKAPKGLLPKNIADLNNEMTLTQLSEKFNISGLNNLPLDSLNKLGSTILYVLAGSAATLIFLLIMLIVSNPAGNSLAAPGAALVISGLMTLLLVRVGTTLTSSLSGFVRSTDLYNVIIGTVVPPIITELMKIWIYGGIVLIVAGIVLFFVKKPD